MASNTEEDSTYDFEASIQISRILKILSDTIKNTEVVLCLPLLLHNKGAILQNHFPLEQVNFIRNICKRLSIKASYDNKEDEDLNSDMCVVIDLVLSKQELVDICRTTLAEDISSGGLTLLRNLEELRFCVAQRLRVTPKMEAAQDAELRRLYQQNLRNKEEVDRLTEKLNKLTLDTEAEVDDKKLLIRKQLEKIAKVKKQCKDSIKRKMDEAEKQINWDIKNSEYLLDELQTAAKAAQYRRDNQLKDHLNSEKELRAKRYKIESQLVTLLQKYDTDIGERQAQLEELTGQFEEEKEQMAELQLKFDEQEYEYENLMLEKEQYERRQWEAKLFDIRCRIAARKIQRFWRAYLATKAKGKKGKKGKKKK